MSIVTVRPSGVAAWGGTWYNTGSYGPGPNSGQVADSNDGTYLYGVSPNTYAEFDTDNYTLAANERCWHARANIRVASNNGVSGYNADVWLKPITAGDGGGFNDTGPRGGPTTLTGAWYGSEWDQNTLNQFRIAIRENYTGVTVVNWYDVWIEYEILHQPVTGTVGPAGTVTTRNPVITWAFSDPDGRLGQRSYRTHVRRSDTGELIYDSQEVFNANQSQQVWPNGLGNGQYQVIVQVSDANWGAWYSNWTYASPDITVNALPDVPTGLARTGGDVTDTSPNFSANLAAYIGYQVQTKVRYEIWNADASDVATTLVGSVDSSYVTSGGAAPAEYIATLPVGRYTVRAQAIEVGGQTSGWSAYVPFQVNVAVSKDLTLLWNAAASLATTTKDLSLLWNVIENNGKQLTLLWTTFVDVTKDITFLWNDNTSWVHVDEGSNTWTQVTE